VNLSAVIFVVLAVAWALYLIPMALKHHDELASDRLDEGHSDRVRILSRHGRKSRAQAPVEDAEPAVDESPEHHEDEPASVVEALAPVRALPTRAAAKRAARNRRRVLAVLLLATAVVAGLAYLAYVPWWSTAIPGGLAVLFLVVARLSVRKASRRRASLRPRAVAPETVLATEDVAPAEQAEVLTAELAGDGTNGLAREQVEAALADDGSLWDPLPMTLPTYVNKARARRTVRTIELTGLTSSGHDESDTALAREAEQSAKDAHDAEVAAQSQRRVAGA
jgi:hypothetical protein